MPLAFVSKKVVRIYFCRRWTTPASPENPLNLPDLENLPAMMFKPHFCFCSMQTTPIWVEKLRSLFDFLYLPHKKASPMKKAWAGLVLANLVITLLNPLTAIFKHSPVRLQALDTKTIWNVIIFSKESSKSWNSERILDIKTTAVLLYKKQVYHKDNEQRDQARIYLQSNWFLLQQLHCEASRWNLWSRNS